MTGWGVTFFIAKFEDELAGIFARFAEVKTERASCDLLNPEKRSGCFLMYGVK